MPVYNAMRYVAAAIDSILAQTLSDFELLIVDDGSNDQTPAILADYAARDPRIRIITRPNGGIVRALNVALAGAKAPLLARMDGDDICLPERFARQAAYLDAHPQCLLVGCRVMLIDPDGEPLYEMDDIETSHEEIDDLLLKGRWPVVHPAIMMRAEAVRSVGGYRERAPVEDHDLFLRLAELGTLANLPEVLFRYRKHSQSMVRTMADRRVGQMKAALEEAWLRRGLTDRSRFPQILPDVDRHEARRDLKQKRNWSWECLRHGNIPTARKYAMASLREAPLDPATWRLLFCAWRGH